MNTDISAIICILSSAIICDYALFVFLKYFLYPLLSKVVIEVSIHKHCGSCAACAYAFHNHQGESSVLRGAVRRQTVFIPEKINQPLSAQYHAGHIGTEMNKMTACR